MMDTARAGAGFGAAQIRRSLEQARESLHAAAAAVHVDPDGALDDILAARLLVGIALMALGAPGVENP